MENGASPDAITVTIHLTNAPSTPLHPSERTNGVTHDAHGLAETNLCGSHVTMCPDPLMLSALFLLLSGILGYAGMVPEGPSPMPADQFTTLTNLVVSREWTAGGWGSATFSMSPEQRKQLNALLPDTARTLSLPTKTSEQARYQTAATLHSLAQLGLLTEPKVIPHLIAGLKTEPGYNLSDSIRSLSLRALSHMTRRMLDAACCGGPSYWPGHDGTNYQAIVKWWENWWKQNEQRRPAYDEELDHQLRAEYFRVVKAIEADVKPHYPEFRLFQARIPLLNCIHQLYEYEYAPYFSSSGIWTGSGTNVIRRIPDDELPWLMIACHFEDEEMPTDWEKSRVNHSPKKLEGYVTCVYSNKIDSTAIYVEVKIASPNQKLVGTLRKVLADVRTQPLPRLEEMPVPQVY